MAHDANDVLGPVVIKGEEPAVAALDMVARYKGRTTRIVPHSRIEIVERNLSIVGFWPAADYLEERYPDPTIFPDTPARRAIVRSISDQALLAPHTILPALLEGYRQGPETRFLLSDELTLLDFVVASVAVGLEPWALYLERINALTDPALREPAVGAAA